MPPVTTASLLALILLSAIFHIRAEYRGPRWQVYLFKPLTTGLILLLAMLLPPAVPAPYQPLILAGLFFSLCGDIFLMLPRDRFVPGLASFLIAHLCYIAAFGRSAGWPLDLRSLLLYVIYGSVMLALLWPYLGTLRLPVTLYVAVILIMGWQALARWQLLGTAGAACAAAGAALFILSDSLLAWDRFRGPFGAARALVLGTYFAAQVLIAYSLTASAASL